MPASGRIRAQVRAVARGRAAGCGVLVMSPSLDGPGQAPSVPGASVRHGLGSSRACTLHLPRTGTRLNRPMAPAPSRATPAGGAWRGRTPVSGGRHPPRLARHSGVTPRNMMTHSPQFATVRRVPPVTAIPGRGRPGRARWLSRPGRGAGTTLGPFPRPLAEPDVMAGRPPARSLPGRAFSDRPRRTGRARVPWHPALHCGLRRR